MLDRGAFEDADEFITDDLALFLGITDAFQTAEKAIGSVNIDEIHMKMAAEDLLNRLGFAFTQKPLFTKTGVS